MATELAEATVRRSGDAAVIELHGDLNAAAHTVVNGAYEKAAQEGTPKIVLNFEEVGYINSTGIALIVSLLGRARSEGRAVTACGLTDHYKHIFEITRLADFMPIFDDEGGALATS